MSKSVIIIGAGIAGIAASIRLAKKGYVVSVFESNTYPGGKLTEIRKNGYRFDAGPSLFTLPQEVEALFELCGENIEDHFAYEKLDVTCKYFYETGENVTAYADKAAFAAELKEKLNEPEKNTLKALDKSAFLYEHLSPLFMEKSLQKRATWIGKDAFKAYKNIPKFDFNRTMNKANESRFENPKTVQLFNRYATYNGSDPYQTPATLNIIPHLEYGIGAYFPKKGMHDITQSLYELAKRQGVKFYFDTKVKSIVTHDGKAKGVNTVMGFHKSDNVVCNMDVVAAYKHLLKTEKQPKKLLKQPKSSSALIFYWGVKKEFKQLDLHNIFFSENYKAEFEHIFKKSKIYEDPTVYINITSTKKNDDAPKGCQNWFTMINVPNDQGQDWDFLISEARKNILKKLSRMLNEDIEGLIETEEILEPRLIQSRTSSSAGALYGNSSNNKYSAFLRHSNASSSISNLYFCGGSVHPGGGIPLCLLSAKITSELIN